MQIKIKNSELSAIKDALILLEAGQRQGAVQATTNDGKPLFFQKPEKDNSESKPVILHTYQGDHKKFVFLEEGSVRYRIARALKQIEKALVDLESKQGEILDASFIAQRNNDKLKDSPNLLGDYLLIYRKENQKLSNTEVALDINRIPFKHLDIDKNAIPATILAALFDTVIEDDSGTLYSAKAAT